MKYIFVTGTYQTKGDNLVLDCCAHHTKAVLYSLIDGFKLTKFGMDTVERVADKLQQLKVDIIDKNDAILVIDSGGYSIIKGEVQPEDVPKLTQLYHGYLVKEKETYDRIFSLDIPINLEWTSFNSKSNIYELNKISIEKSIKVIKEYPEISNKFFFVNHFKMRSQHSIWRKLISEFNLNEIIKHRSIGGLVSIRKYSKLKSSPIVGPFYQLLLDHINSPYIKEFKVHFLGVYNVIDRFVISLLECLTAKYLPNATIELSYDTIYFFRNATKNVKYQRLYKIDEEMNLTDTSLSGASERDIDNIYYTDDLKTFYYDNLNQISTENKMSNVAAFAPINIHNEMLIDVLIKSLIEKYDLHNSFDLKLYSKFINTWKRFVSDMHEKYHSIFENDHLKELQKSADNIYQFHQWYRDGCNKEKFNAMINTFIQMINFPFDLT